MLPVCRPHRRQLGSSSVTLKLPGPALFAGKPSKAWFTAWFPFRKIFYVKDQKDIKASPDFFGHRPNERILKGGEWVDTKSLRSAQIHPLCFTLQQIE